MSILSVEPGSPVVVTDAAGEEHEMLALSGVEEAGHSFPIVWVQRPLRDGGSDRIPWPAEAVRPA